MSGGLPGARQRGRRRAATARRAGARLAVAAMLLSTGVAQAGALDDCGGSARAAADLTACLQAARRQATDRMLEGYLSVEQKLQRHDHEALRERGRAALKQSQRDFERYLHAHCQVAQRLAVGSAAAPLALACEVDQMRARAAALEGLDRDTD